MKLMTIKATIKNSDFSTTTNALVDSGSEDCIIGNGSLSDELKPFINNTAHKIYGVSRKHVVPLGEMIGTIQIGKALFNNIRIIVLDNDQIALNQSAVSAQKAP